jgi:hypothetical protein
MSIPQNESMPDRFARLAIGGLLLISTSYIILPLWPTLGIMAAGLYLLFSGLAGQCLVYKILNISSCK